MTAWWAELSVAKKVFAVLFAVASGSATIGGAVTYQVSEARFVQFAQVDSLLDERVDSLFVALEDIRINTCLTLVEVRNEPNADRCRR